MSLTLSTEQFTWLKAAIGRQRKAEKILQRMRRVSHYFLIKQMPNPTRRKQLSIKPLRLI
jgi:hypothetical protein